MKVVLFATRTAGALAPISEFSCLALLSVACKPLIVHSVEAIAMAGLTDVIVAVSPDADAIEAALGDGARWGMQFEYVRAARGESDENLVQRIRDRLGDEYLSVRGEILRTPIIKEFVERAKALAAPAVTATIGGVQAGLTLIKCTTLEKIASESDSDPSISDGCASCVEFPRGHLALLESFTAFHRAHLDILAGQFRGLVIPGRVMPQVKFGRHTSLRARSIKQAPLLIGSRCRIANDADLGGNVMVSDDVVIDSRAVLRSAVIMPHTYVGELVEIDHAIVAGNRLIHVDTGVVATVTDSFLLAKLHPEEIVDRVRSFTDRILGAILLVASVWLWPIALIAAVAENPRRPLRSRLLLGNRESEKKVEFRTFEFAASIPTLRYLPYLFAVVAGHLRLIGGAPIESGQDAAPGENSEIPHNRVYAGLSGLMRSVRFAQAAKRQRKVPRTSLRNPLAE